MTIVTASTADIAAIRRIAHQTWPETFGAILSAEQIAYMLDWMYASQALEAQMTTGGHQFFLAMDGEEPVGFVSCQPDYKDTPTIKVHKLYILPDQQGKGVGRLLLEKVAGVAKKQGNTTLSLNVNRYNKAVAFYEKTGFSVAGQENIDIGNGFLMEDYIMEKPL
ncbi:GNAT family N-acetyltransferase [Arsenicibacter rosenii]|uniref:GNAT family N-acetyltransferase n=1 Tax=Arsenicibacter rosenii TaxID=1750698 RepID=A0A1S2VGD1_9BACT|nr:GNAT family N-acetyltransferase [Arsenicibacter rosenii]